MPSRSRPFVLDSSILIAYLRSGRYCQFIISGLERGTIFVPGVVLCEIYAGAISREDLADVEVLRRALGHHVLQVDSLDWVLAGRCLARYGRRWGKVRPRDHLVDVVVAVVAFQAGAVLVSEDLHQMSRWQWVLGRLGMRLEVKEIQGSQ